jgi:beta-fructofuranosidase
MNDPHGVHFDGENYHLFYQYVPEVTKWESKLFWGHAISADLIDWQEVQPALAPLDDEVGCWSGSVVINDGAPVMFYTRPTSEDWGRGQVVSAIGNADRTSWTRTAQSPLINGPEDGHSFYDFRDPQVRRDGDVWKMTIGAGIRDKGGAALQYSSTDLLSWNFDGVLATRLSTELQPLYTGTVWECPQFIKVGEHWVLIISAMDGKDLSQALYTIGEYDGKQFTPQHWGFFGHNQLMYATTVFHDKDNRPCAISWLREANNETPKNSPWASAQGIAVVLEVVNNQLVLTPHPDLDMYLTERSDVSSPLTVDNVGSAWRLAVDLVAESALNVVVAGDTTYSIAIDRAHDVLVVEHESKELLEMPLSAEPGVLDIVADADLLEIYWSAGSGSAAVRVPAMENATVTMMGKDFEGRLAR